MAIRRKNIKKVFDNLRKRTYNRAQMEMTKGMPYVMEEVDAIANDIMKSLNKSDMTGNYINSFGIAIYRNGEFIACVTSNEIEGQDPIQLTLASGDTFQVGRSRYDGNFQKRTFVATMGSRRIYADQVAEKWLRRYRPRVQKDKESIAYRIVTVVDYAKIVGGDKVLMAIANDIEQRGGDIREFRFA